MTQASENKFLWKKLTALFVAFVLCLTMVQLPTQEAMAAAKDVTSITLPKVEGITWADDYGTPLSEDPSDDYNVSDEVDRLVLTPNGTFSKNTTIRAYTNTKPVVSVSAGGATFKVVSDSQEDDQGTYYELRITLGSSAKGEVILGASVGTEKFTVTFPQNDYAVYFIQNDLGGTIQQYEKGAKVSFDVKLLDNTKDITVRANENILEGSLKGGTSDVYSYTIDSIQRNTTISITAKNKTFQVTLPASTDSYTVTPSGTFSVDYGSSYTFYVTPKTGYQAPTVQVNGSPLSSVGNNQYVITNITKDQTITIVPAEKEQFRLTFNHGEGYYFTTPEGTKIEGSQQVAYGENFQFKVVLDEDYSQSHPTVTVNNINISNQDGVYTISNVKADQVVNVTGIQKNTYTVNMQSGEGYSLTALVSTRVTAGDSFIFTLSIADGYQKGENFSVKADGERLELNSYGQYVYTVKKDTLISVEGVEATTFKAVVSGGENATVEAANGSDANRIAYNGSYHFTVKPNDYYEVTQVAVNGEVKEAVNGVYTVNNVTGNLTITVVTSPLSVTVQLVDEKFDNSKTQTYTIADMPEGSLALNDAVTSSELYAFAGWYNTNGEKVTQITPADLNNGTVTLTAKWRPSFGDSLTLTAQGVQTNEDGTYTIQITTSIDFQKLSEEYNANVRITGYGTLYGAEVFDTSDESIANAILNRSPAVQDGLLTQSSVAGKKLTNYYRNRDFAPANFDNQWYGLEKRSSNPMHRYAAGWMELSVDGEKVIVFSNVCEITAPQA